MFGWGFALASTQCIRDNRKTAAASALLHSHNLFGGSLDELLLWILRLALVKEVAALWDAVLPALRS
jgi:hypothetical protein